jgi:hypothetical protein
MTGVSSIVSLHQYFTVKRFRLFLLPFLTLMTFFSAATGQEGDFYQFLSENNSLNEFLKPQLSNRLIPFAGNENVNKKRLQSGGS